MILVITELIPDVLQDEDATSKTKSKADNIDEGIAFLPPHGSEGNLEKMVNHHETLSYELIESLPHRFICAPNELMSKWATPLPHAPHSYLKASTGFAPAARIA
jgi:hypothetical protein